MDQGTLADRAEYALVICTSSKATGLVSADGVASGLEPALSAMPGGLSPG